MRQADSTDTTLTPISRPVVEAQISLLIDLLDTLDNDADAEPSLGWTASSGHYLETPADLIANANHGDDREADDEREPHEDDEPSLGWTHHPNQASPHWNTVAMQFGGTDLEDGVGAVRKKRPASMTGAKVFCGAAIF